MCGVFGFVSRDNSSVNLKILERVALVTESRGKHAWGMAWIDGNGRMRMYKQTGRVGDSLALLRMAADARFLIGHCRYATQGNPKINTNNHPHPADGGWVVHNGMIPNYDDLVTAHGLHPVGVCDSEVLGLLIEQADGTLLERCIEAAGAVFMSPLVLLGLWKPGRLVAVRRGNPLHLGTTSKGFYLASLADGLPGKVEAVANNQAIEFGEEVAREAVR
jgi:glucosamine 6-phosphate synthetase-like amidotransferase/phosphosugar isomerase protein